MFQMLVLCQANVCRSPFAQTLLANALSEDPGVHIASAGVQTRPGYELCQVAGRLLGTAAPAEHLSRPVSEELVMGSDLILTMEPEHSAMVSALCPSARHRTYTLVEASALAVEARARGMLSDPQWVRQLPEVLNDLRGLVPVPELQNPRGRWRGRLEPGRIADGHGLGYTAHERVLRQVEQHAKDLAGQS